MPQPPRRITPASHIELPCNEVTGPKGAALAARMGAAARKWWASIVAEPHSLQKPTFFLGFQGWTVTNLLPDGAHERTKGRVRLLPSGATGFEQPGDRMCFGTEVGRRAPRRSLSQCLIAIAAAPGWPARPGACSSEGGGEQQELARGSAHARKRPARARSPPRLRAPLSHDMPRCTRAFPLASHLPLTLHHHPLQVMTAGKYEVTLLYTSRTAASFKMAFGSVEDIDAAPFMAAQLPVMVRVCGSLVPVVARIAKPKRLMAKAPQTQKDLSRAEPG